MGPVETRIVPGSKFRPRLCSEKLSFSRETILLEIGNDPRLKTNRLDKLFITAHPLLQFLFTDF